MKEKASIGSPFFGAFPSDHIPKVTKEINVQKFSSCTSSFKSHQQTPEEDALCVCQQRDQTLDHLIYDCNLLEAQRGILRTKVTKNGQCPADKNELLTKHIEHFLTYIESIDFDRL